MTTDDLSGKLDRLESLFRDGPPAVRDPGRPIPAGRDFAGEMLGQPDDARATRADVAALNARLDRVEAALERAGDALNAHADLCNRTIHVIDLWASAALKEQGGR